MVLPIPNLDDRRFKDLSEEGRERLKKHLPELTQIAPGDPAHAMVDLFAYLTENILYRMNLIPERQRRAVMNLLQIPQRMAKPSRGLVCIDSGPRSVNLPGFIRDGAQLKASSQHFTAHGEVQPTPLGLSVSIKRSLSDDELTATGLTHEELRQQFGIKRGENPQPFEPKNFKLGQENLSLTESLDKYFYIACTLPKTLVNERTQVIENLTGIIFNIAIAPADDIDAEEISSLEARKLNWELMSLDDEGNLLNLPLEIIADSSRGGREMGVVRLRLPDNTELFDTLTLDDPMFSGLGKLPPELPAPLTNERVAFWLRLSAEDEPDLTLGYLGANGVDVSGQGLKKDLVIAVGNGNPGQIAKLPDKNIAPESLVLQVEEDGAWVSWQRVDFLVDQGGEAKVYRLDANEGVVYFGDGLEGGRRPPQGKRIRIANYLYGGGSQTNLQAGEIKEVVNSSRVYLRHEWPCKGGIDAESVTQAEKRIPLYLTHRNRAVTKQDFKILSENNPVNPVARAEVFEGFLPGANINAARENVQGVVSVFVLKPATPALRKTPKPSKGLLKDVFEYLLQRLLIGTELYVLSPEFIPIAVGVKIDVLDPENEQQTRQAVQNTLINYLWSLAPGGALGQGWGMGVNVKSSELQTQVARVNGVRAVNALDIFEKSTNHWRRLPMNEEVKLRKYQLPMLMGVSVGTGSGQPDFPRGIEAEARDGSGVPAPVIPEVC